MRGLGICISKAWGPVGAGNLYFKGRYRFSSCVRGGSSSISCGRDGAPRGPRKLLVRRHAGGALPCGVRGNF